MVIENTHLFAGIVRKFQANLWLRDLEIAVYDFFSDQLIWGMHAYRNTVKWRKSDEGLFPDTCPVQPNERLHDDSDLAPAAIHCKNPSCFQAFHFGVHRGLKALQPGRVVVRRSHMYYHWAIIEKTRQHFLRARDARLGYAVLGAELACLGRLSTAHVDYSNPLLGQLFDLYKDLTPEELRSQVWTIGLRSLGFLPSKLRLRMLSALFRARARLNTRPGADS
jgi:hypothetical protein